MGRTRQSSARSKSRSHPYLPSSLGRLGRWYERLILSPFNYVRKQLTITSTPALPSLPCEFPTFPALPPLSRQDVQSFIRSAQQGNFKPVQEYISKGGDVHVANDLALILSSRDGNVEIVKILLEAGADVHAESEQALRFGAAGGHIEVVKVLLEAGADVHARDDEAVITVAMNGSVETLLELVACGADVQGAITAGALTAAAMNGQLAIAKILSEASSWGEGAGHAELIGAFTVKARNSNPKEMVEEVTSQMPGAHSVAHQHSCFRFPYSSRSSKFFRSQIFFYEFLSVGAHSSCTEILRFEFGFIVFTFLVQTCCKCILFIEYSKVDGRNDSREGAKFEISIVVDEERAKLFGFGTEVVAVKQQGKIGRGQDSCQRESFTTSSIIVAEAWACGIKVVAFGGSIESQVFGIKVVLAAGRSIESQVFGNAYTFTWART
ncbi:hypothetical protein HDV00_012427 [Rhizophlyctis rosea]|nr:hypothetical protein HDV00_012427 [Rhizophlyctis rosea]